MTHTPATESDLCAIVAEARAKKTPLAIEGGGTRAGLGRPVQTAETVSMRDIDGIVFYEPAEMVICARAGASLAAVQALLAERNQILPFEPPDHRRLYGSTGEPTIGAIAACNLSGSRRIAVGAARDALIGVRFVNGAGEAIKNGGRVMKNVTGLDLVKLSCGAHGTLGALTEVTFKLLPKPETSATLVLKGLDDARAVQALAQALGSPFEVSGAAHLPAGVGGDSARTLLRIENFENSVRYRIGELRKLVGGDVVLDDAASRDLWRDVSESGFFAAQDDQHAARAIWRVSTAPSRAPDFVRIVQRAGAVAHYYDWGGGLVWLAVEAAGDARANEIHAAIGVVGGHATLVRAPEEVRAHVEVFQPLAEPLMQLTRNVKASIDPDGIINPGRMYAGI